MKGRISNLAKTESEWLKLNFKPLAGELVIYMPDSTHKHSRIKIGDGEHTLHELPFIVESIANNLLSEYTQPAYVDAGRITNYFYN